ncbi:MAG: transcriptional regulator [Pyrobaculum sp.]|jgi:DNA-binding transcriptional ArsR family regulator|uniref:transcriptional regulator n=1 Tax=Pyrobaculum sp. 3827-6 TaxID=2983604 RepID=UPI0021D911F0|nr:transcriptional regulator [Pyrobaculum sp. 3827-6]MCU7786961.1 transcriptional regulator [Pyrobaculum sp. 3827-6]
MNRYLLAAIVVAAFTAALSVVFPRLAPIAVRIGVVALIIIAGFWVYEYLTTRPPRLAGRILAMLRSRGPMTLREIVLEAGADYQEVEEALRYLLERGVVRRYLRDNVEYYDI